MGDTADGTYMEKIIDKLTDGSFMPASGEIATGVQAYIDKVQDALNPISGMDAPLVAAALKVVYKGVMDSMPKSGRKAAKTAHRLATSCGVENKSTVKAKTRTETIKSSDEDAADILALIKQHAGNPDAMASALRELGFTLDPKTGAWEKKEADKEPDKEPEERPACEGPATEGLM